MNETREQIERKIIGALLLDPARIAVMLSQANVNAAWFADAAHAAIYETAFRQLSAGKLDRLDAFALLTETRRLAADKKWKRGIGVLEADIGRFASVVTEEAAMLGQVDWYIGQLRTVATQEILGRSYQAAMRRFSTDPLGSISAMMDGAAKSYSAMSGEVQLSKATICAALEAAEAESYHQRVDPSGPKNLDWVPGLSAPWPEMTRLYLGIGARFHLIAARPSVGKTSFAINLMRFWADRGVKVLVNSLDMPPDDIIDRMRTEYSRVSIAKKRYTPTTENLSKLRAASEWVRSSSVEIVEQTHVEDFVLELTMRAKTGRVDVAIVDYVQLLSSYAVDNANEYERVSFVAEYLKRAANRLKIPVIALCQLNRKGAKDDNAEPTLTDLRGSGALEQAASSVVLLHREYPVVEKWRTDPPHWLYQNEQYGRQVASSSIDAVWFILAKNQNGPTGKLPFVVNKPYFAWKLGDNNITPSETVTGHGATQRVVKDWRQAFERIHRDWRGDDWEQSLAGKLYPYAIGGHAAFPVLI